MLQRLHPLNFQHVSAQLLHKRQNAKNRQRGPQPSGSVPLPLGRVECPDPLNTFFAPPLYARPRFAGPSLTTSSLPPSSRQRPSLRPDLKHGKRCVSFVQKCRTWGFLRAFLVSNFEGLHVGNGRRWSGSRDGTTRTRDYTTSFDIRDLSFQDSTTTSVRLLSRPRGLPLLFCRSSSWIPRLTSNTQWSPRSPPFHRQLQSPPPSRAPKDRHPLSSRPLSLCPPRQGFHDPPNARTQAEPI